MKMNLKNAVLFLFPLVLAAAGLQSCKADNELESSLKDYTDLALTAKYTSFNLNYGNKVKGVAKISLSGSQAFDSSYWGWEEPSVFLENEGKTVSRLRILDRPEPQLCLEDSANYPFADGTFANSRSYTGIVRPSSIEEMSRTKYDVSGDQTTDSTPTTYKISYTQFTGELETYTIKTTDSSTDVHKKIYTFSSDPRSYSDYYVSNFTVQDGSADNPPQVGAVNISIEVDATSDPQTETYTYLRRNAAGELGSFDASGDLGILDSTFFDDTNSSTIVKIVRTVGYYAEATADISADSIRVVTVKYSDASTIVYRDMAIYHYENYALRLLKDYRHWTHYVSDGTYILSSQEMKYYENGWATLEYEYSVAAGQAELLTTITTTRDSQGRPNTYTEANNAGSVYYKKEYGFDEYGRTSTIRSYDVDTSTAVKTCSDTINQELAYESITSTSNEELREISTTTYSCNGSQLSDDPASRIVRTYNGFGQLRSIENYKYSSGNFTRTSKQGWEYNPNGTKLKDQYYEVDSDGSPTISNYTVYDYDSYLFRISTIDFTAEGDISADYFEYNYIYQ